MAFMRAVNPCVDWTETQWRLIVDEASLPLSTQYVLQCITTSPKKFGDEHLAAFSNHGRSTQQLNVVLGRDVRCMAAQVSERYRSLWKSGLTQRGLEKTYEDGYGDVDNDYETLFWAEQVRLASISPRNVQWLLALLTPAVWVLFAKPS